MYPKTLNLRYDRKEDICLTKLFILWLSSAAISVIFKVVVKWGKTKKYAWMAYTVVDRSLADVKKLNWTSYPTPES